MLLGVIVCEKGFFTGVGQGTGEVAKLAIELVVVFGDPLNPAFVQVVIVPFIIEM